MNSIEACAIECIKNTCKIDKGFAKNVELLDQYDFSKIITNGRSLQNIRDTLEELYEKEFYKNNGIYMFDYLSNEELCWYLTSRYNVWFQEYTDWVVRHNDSHEETRRRT